MLCGSHFYKPLPASRSSSPLARGSNSLVIPALVLKDYNAVCVWRLLYPAEIVVLKCKSPIVKVWNFKPFNKFNPQLELLTVPNDFASHPADHSILLLWGPLRHTAVNYKTTGICFSCREVLKPFLFMKLAGHPVWTKWIPYMPGELWPGMSKLGCPRSKRSPCWFSHRARLEPGLLYNSCAW